MKVLLLADWGRPFYPGLRKKFPQVEFAEAYADAEIRTAVADAEIVFGYLTGEQFRLGRRIRCIQTLDAGMEGLFRRIPDIVETDIVVTNARGAGAPQIGEHAVALILALARGLPDFWKLKREHKWDQPHGLSIVEIISGRTAGIIGFGKSGKEIGWRCKALGMNVCAVDKHAVDGAPVVAEVWSLDRLPQLLAQSDYVIVTVPYSAANENMIGARELGMMKPTARLIVTSRGRIVEHKALVDALRNRRIAGAGLDVVVQEPLPPDNELWELENVIITPHIAGNSPELDQWTYD
ncbi:MAG: D-2-hydroxyacid dehydrogenase, partial [Chloroflexi bacterium]|nr:D-2-hydroxyacid dehydrogenase [Chloroflexota bacterium]